MRAAVLFLHGAGDTGGERMNVWFNRSERWQRLGVGDTEDAPGITRSLDAVLSELQGLRDYDGVFVGGFSMGGGLALHLLRLALPANVLGVFSLGSFLVDSSAVYSELNEATSALPLLMMHGIEDGMIPTSWGQRTASSLLRKGVDVQFRSFSKLDHEIGDEQLETLVGWMEENLLLRDESPDTCLAASALGRKVHDEHIGFPFVLEEGSTGTVQGRFFVPHGSEAYLSQRPVLCNGGVFDIAVHPNGGVTTDFTSADPGETARQISRRLLNRLQGESGDMNPCPVS